MTGAFLGEGDRIAAARIADDVLGVPRPTLRPGGATLDDVLADAAATRDALAARQAAHEAAEGAALGEPDPAPAAPEEPAPIGPSVALVPGHGSTDSGPTLDLDAIASAAWRRL